MNRAYVLQNLINSVQAKTVCEVGIWAGDTSFFILNNCKNLKQYFMVDPLKYDLNFFDHHGSELDHPKHMQLGTYKCTMGDPLKSQDDLDKMYEGIIMKLGEYPNAKFLREESLEAAKKFNDGELDIVFIDAIHLYEFVKQDIEAWLPKIRKGGILCGDDYTSTFPGVIRAVNETFQERVRVNSPVWSVIVD